MKIGLITPFNLYRPNFRLSEDGRIDDFFKEKVRSSRAYSPSDSLLQLAALTPTGHEVFYMDDQFGSVNFDESLDLAAITVITPSADRAYEIAEEYKRRGVYVVMGGVHVSLCPEEASKHGDTIVVGDADNIWMSFLSDFRRGRAKKMYNGGMARIGNSPPPRIDLLPPEKFRRTLLQTELYSLRTSVGCTRRCKYCTNWEMSCNKIRKKTLRQIKREIKHISARSQIFTLSLIDDNPFLDIKHITRVLHYFKDVGVRWIGPADISISDHPKLLKLIRESGCTYLCFGLESLNPENLKWLAPWKSKFVKSYKERIRILRDHGLNVMGSFMVGLERDTPETFQQDFDFFIETNLVTVGIAIITPLPGTSFRQRLIDEKRLDLNAPWSDYTGFNLLYTHPTLSKQEMYDGVLWFLKKCNMPEVQEHMQKAFIR